MGFAEELDTVMVSRLTERCGLKPTQTLQMYDAAELRCIPGPFLDRSRTAAENAFGRTSTTNTSDKQSSEGAVGLKPRSESGGH